MMPSVSKLLLVNLIVIIAGACISNIAGAAVSYGNTEQVSTDVLIDLSLEELMNVEVNTVSWRSQRISEVAAFLLLRKMTYVDLVQPVFPRHCAWHPV